jgi:amino acid transporter
VSALAILAAGQYAWVALLMVAAVLYLFRKIYGEVVGALPLNGGAYNALLNTTSKATASMAACLTLLSYMATAVISANEAMHYVHILWEGTARDPGHHRPAGPVHGPYHPGHRRVVAGGRGDLPHPPGHAQHPGRCVRGVPLPERL